MSDTEASLAVQSRLPPAEGSLPEAGEAPTESSVVRCRGSGLFRMMPLPAQDAPEDSEEGWVKVKFPPVNCQSKQDNSPALMRAYAARSHRWPSRLRASMTGHRKVF